MASTRDASKCSTLRRLSITIEDTGFELSRSQSLSSANSQIARPPPCAQAHSRSQESLSILSTNSTQNSSQMAPRSDSPRVSTASATPRSSTSSSRSSLEKTFRSPSASSVWYHLKKVPIDDVMPLGASADPELVKEFLELAENRAEALKSSEFQSRVFQVGWFFSLLCIIYFGFIGLPLWNGIVYSFYKWLDGATRLQNGFLVFFLWGTCIAWLPQLLVRYEKNAKTDSEKASAKSDSSETCLLIPAYKAADALPTTIEHALKIFKPNQIFILANGNSPMPLDNTEDVCKHYGVNHAWIPIGSKITAEFVGVMLAKDFKYAMLIDDDVHLPADLPIVTNRIKSDRKPGSTVCIGYTIQSTGPDGTRGTLVQQAQDLEYKLSGLSKHFQGTYGSAVFPHGAIILWDRDILEKLFWSHPGHKISEDWYFGHTCRSAGFRIEFCTQVFVPTETPPSLFIPVKSNRGGYGEMTVWKQRFYRWNFFYLYRLREDLNYLFFAWRLGRYELVTKLFVFAEVYETFVYFSSPIMLPIALIVQPKIVGALFAGLLGMYVLAAIFFNAVHLRRKKAMVAWKVLPVYFLMKFALSFVNTLSVYYSLYAYAEFFSRRHPRVTENYSALIAAKQCLDDDYARRESEIQIEVVSSEEEEHVVIAPILPAKIL